ncbi:MAG TPA: HlyD family type I secretion periplasmic adaptor subunit [Burkholderiales bacterium]|nr:HlyD family type I secretion periplasmic adaptor subunit [Burkholderiales bacterium]
MNEPSPLARGLLWTLIVLLGAVVAWMFVGRLDVVAVADGRLVPRSQLKIVQPAEGGVLRELLVAEGNRVRAGEVLARMDMRLAQADGQALETELEMRELQLARVDAELRSERLEGKGALYEQVEAQRDARVRAHENALAEERAVIARARRDMAAAQETRAKLAAALPVLAEQEQAFQRLANEGFAGKLMLRQRSRERLEAEQDLRAQEHRVESARATIEQAERRMSQLTANYRAQLRSERLEAERERSRLAQELEKLRHRKSLAELRAPADGVVKDLATQSVGAVLAPGAVLMTLVPAGESLLAEVWLQNQDAGFVRAGQAARVKVASFPFQRYGTLEARVLRISADATERDSKKSGVALAYRALLELDGQELKTGDLRHALLPGMQVSAEIRLAERSVIEYVLSPLQKVAAEAGRER